MGFAETLGPPLYAAEPREHSRILQRHNRAFRERFKA